MKEPSPFFRQQADWADKFNKKLVEMPRNFKPIIGVIYDLTKETKSKLRFIVTGWEDAAGAATKYGKTVGVIATAWSNALREMFRPEEADPATWESKFADALTGIRSAWAMTMNDVMTKGGNMQDFLENMFLGILNSFNRLISEMAANELLYAIFGQKAGMEGPRLMTLVDAFLGKDKGHIGTGMPMPPLSGFKDNLTRTGSGWLNPLSIDSFSSAYKMAQVTVNNNITNNTGTQITAKKSAPHFNGKQWVINTVLEAYDTDPNVRSRLGG